MIPDKNFIAHVPALRFLSEVSRPNYHEEYLVHGVVEGAYYKAISHDAFDSIDSPFSPRWNTQLREVRPTNWPGPTSPQAKKDGTDAMKVACKFGTHFTLAVFLATISAKLIHAHYETTCTQLRTEIMGIVNAIDCLSLGVPYAWFERCIMVQSAIDATYLMDAKIQLLCMRVLVYSRYPMRVAKNWPGLEQSAEDDGQCADGVLRLAVRSRTLRLGVPADDDGYGDEQHVGVGGAEGEYGNGYEGEAVN